MSRTRVKFCGITRIEDARKAASLGVDAIGLVFYAPSPRAVSLSQAAAICAELPPFICRTGLFVNASRRQIEQTLEQVPIDLLQFHGDESAAECERWQRSWIKAVRVATQSDITHAAETYPGASALLLDAWKAGQYGGTGVQFGWELVPKSLSKSVILAGGLNPDNIGTAISTVRPYAVDVSGGIESAKGIKDPEKMTAFMRGIQRVSD